MHKLLNLPATRWSAKSPEACTIFHDGRTRGIGLAFNMNPADATNPARREAWEVSTSAGMAAWNLLHDKFDWSLWIDQQNGVSTWSAAKFALSQTHQGSTLADTLLTLGPVQWPIWWKANRKAVNSHYRTAIDQAMAMRRSTATS